MTRRTPQQKKALRYKKERRTGALHGYVKSYPETKARINRAYRHEAKSFFRDEPDCERQLKAWIVNMELQYSGK